MAKYLMLGRYSAEAVKGIQAQRTKKVEALIKQVSGKSDHSFPIGLETGTFYA